MASYGNYQNAFTETLTRYGDDEDAFTTLGELLDQLDVITQTASVRNQVGWEVGGVSGLQGALQLTDLCLGEHFVV